MNFDSLRGLLFLGHYTHEKYAEEKIVESMKQANKRIELFTIALEKNFYTYEVGSIVGKHIFNKKKTEIVMNNYNSGNASKDIEELINNHEAFFRAIIDEEKQNFSTNKSVDNFRVYLPPHDMKQGGGLLVIDNTSAILSRNTYRPYECFMQKDNTEYAGKFMRLIARMRANPMLKTYEGQKVIDYAKEMFGNQSNSKL